VPDPEEGAETLWVPLQLEEGSNGVSGCGKSLQKLPWAADM
jgi:hypothetical protein